MLEQLPVHEKAPSGNLVERIVGRTVRSVKNIFTLPPASQSSGFLDRVATTPGHMLANGANEVLGLGTDAVAGIVKYSWRKISALIGSTVRLTGRALLNAPIIAVPR